MKNWQLQEAKAKFSHVVDESLRAPQLITVRGVKRAVLINFSDYQNLTKSEDNLTTFFKNSPLSGLNLDLQRDKSMMRDFTL